MRYWLGVVSREHVRRGVELAIAQIGHGKRAGLARMQPGDWLIYYSPRTSLGSREPLQAFTAIGEVCDEEVWQADEGSFKPWRRRVSYDAAAVERPLSELSGSLELTSSPELGPQAAPRAHRAERARLPRHQRRHEGARCPSAGSIANTGAASDSPGFLLWQVTNRWQAAQRAALKPFGLTHVQFVLLASLAWLEVEGPITQRRLADHAATDPMMTSQVLRVLQARGLITRTPHPQDGRAQMLAVTPAGAALANRAVVAVERCDRDFFEPLGAAAAGFTSSLGTLAAGPMRSGLTEHRPAQRPRSMAPIAEGWQSG